MPLLSSRDDGHDYAGCPDRDCPRFPCRVYREGWHDGWIRGYAEGEAAGYAAGYADGASASART